MKKVLIIEHENQLLENTTAFLNRNGFEVVQAKEGSVGVQKALEHLPDIILCDSDTPGLSGYEVFNTLQQINTTAIIPFIFIKNSQNYEEIKAVMRLGADDYIIKPYDLNDLYELITTRLEKQERIINIADEKFNTLMEFSTNGIFIYQDGRFSYVNKKFCEIVAYSQNELLGTSLVNMVYKDDIHIVIEKMERCLKGIHKELEVSFRAISRDQKMIQVILSGSCINIRSKKSIIGTMRLANERLNNMLVNIQHLDIKITKREKEILTFICDGLSNNEISDFLNISERTVEGHRANLIKKTNCRNSVCLAIFAIKHGLYEVN